MSAMPGLVLRDGLWVPNDPVDPFDDEESLECGLENPEVCESCQ